MSIFRNANFVPYRDRPLCFLDTETTGLKAGHHEITEIGFRHQTKGNICIQIAPLHIERAEYEALKVSGYNSSDWVEARPFSAEAARIREYLEGATLIAHNAPFDIDMLKGSFEMARLECDDLFRDVICTQALARMFLVPLGLNLLSLKACMKFIGIEYEDAHNAYSDTIFVEHLYNFILKNIKWHGTVNGKRIQEKLF